MIDTYNLFVIVLLYIIQTLYIKSGDKKMGDRKKEMMLVEDDLKEIEVFMLCPPFLPHVSLVKGDDKK